MKTSYIIEELKLRRVPEDIVETVNAFLKTENLYLAATRVVTTLLDNLNEDFKYNKEYNPIQQIRSRVKTPTSIIEKLSRRGFDVNIQSARKYLTDIAGVRVICSYIDDIYLIAEFISSQKDIKIVRVSDYVKEPKSNGYRSCHLIVEVPVFLSNGTEYVNVEIQLRTIAMDFWASLEHHLYYKYSSEKEGEIASELKDCAEAIANIDERMQGLYNLVIK